MTPQFEGFQVFDPVRVPISELHEDPDNLNTHTDADLDATFKSMQSFGQVETLVMRKSTKTIVGGNGRLRSMTRAGWDSAVVIPVEGTDDQIAALGIALNKTPKNSEFDFSRLVDKLQDLEATGDPRLLAATGFYEHELEPLLAAEMNMGAGADFNDDDFVGPTDEEEESTKLAARGMTVQFSVDQKVIIDKALMSHRMLTADASKSPADCLTEIVTQYLDEDSESE